MINIAILIGNVGKKLTRDLKNGDTVTTLMVATNKKFMDSKGECHQETTWHNVNCFSTLSERAIKHINVGDIVYVQGDIEHRLIPNGPKEGQYSYAIHATDVRFIPKGKKYEDLADKVMELFD